MYVQRMAYALWGLSMHEGESETTRLWLNCHLCVVVYVGVDSEGWPKGGKVRSLKMFQATIESISSGSVIFKSSAYIYYYYGIKRSASTY